MMATTVRVEEKLAVTLRDLAAEERRPIGQVIESAIAQYQKEKFWNGVHDDFTRLRSDPAAWKDYQDELALFEGGSMDCLLYTSDAADDLTRVDLCGRRI